jgi:hypothetical protein
MDVLTKFNHFNKWQYSVFAYKLQWLDYNNALSEPDSGQCDVWKWQVENTQVS